jgi:hypothetical protein
MWTELWNPVTIASFELPTVRFGDLTPDEFADLQLMLQQWAQRLGRNALRERYYNGKNRLKDLGISIPPSLKKVETVIGWPAKAVDALAARSIFDGFVSPSSQYADEVTDLFQQNDFALLYGQSTVDELVHSCSFITLTGGGSGEPRVLLTSHSAQSATGLWDSRRKRLRCGLTITQGDSKGQPTVMNLYADTAVITITYDGYHWRSQRLPHNLGIAPIEVLAFRPSTRRPFGKSRISRAVMSITDSAVRAALRSEVAAEFYTTPQKYLLGVDSEVQEKLNKWEAYVGNIFTATSNAEGDNPQFGQLAQMTMQPHIEYMRSLAARFAGETSIPVSSLGIIHDNPSSAEAIYAAREDLIIECQELNRSNGRALRNLGLMAASVLAGHPVDRLSDDERAIAPRFRNPALPSPVSQSDAIVKQVAAIPWIAETRVALEELGYTDEQITRMLSDKRRSTALDTVKQMSVTEKEATPTQAEVQGKALKGAQTQSLIAIMAQYAAGSLSLGQAVGLVSAAIGIPKEEARAILEGDIGEPRDTQAVSE